MTVKGINKSLREVFNDIKGNRRIVKCETYDVIYAAAEIPIGKKCHVTIEYDECVN
jgi:hypothetical protein